MATDNKGIVGKLVRVKIGEKYIKCQSDCTVSFNNTFEEGGGCKPDGDDPVTEASFIDRILESQDVQVTVDARQFLDDLDGASLTQADIVAQNLTGDVSAELEVLTTPGQHSGDNEYLLTINSVISAIELSYPASGRATSSYTFLGDGTTPTQSVIPVTGG